MTDTNTTADHKPARKRRHVSEFNPAARSVAAYEAAIDDLTHEIKQQQELLEDMRERRTSLIRSGPSAAEAIDALKFELRETEDRIEDLSGLRESLLDDMPGLQRAELLAADNTEVEVVDQAWAQARQMLDEEYPGLAARIVVIAQAVQRAQQLQLNLSRRRAERQKILFDEPLRAASGLRLSISLGVERNATGHRVSVIGFAQTLHLPGVAPSDIAPENVPPLWPQQALRPMSIECERSTDADRFARLPRSENPDIKSYEVRQ